MRFLSAAIILILLTGCAGEGLKVRVETSGEGASAEKKVSLETDYQVENGFTLERDGDGYKVDLGSATTKDAEVGLMTEMLRMMQAMMGMAGFPANSATVEQPNMDTKTAFELGVLEGRRKQSEEFNKVFGNRD